MNRASDPYETILFQNLAFVDLEAEKVFRETVAENFPNLVKGINVQIQK